MRQFIHTLKRGPFILGPPTLFKHQRFPFSDHSQKGQSNKINGALPQKISQDNHKIQKKDEDQLIMKEISEYYQKQEIEQLERESSKYSIIDRNFNETRVPGLQARKYSDLSQLQQDIISTNKFDLMNAQVTPKTGSSNTYAGIVENLTQITLGGVKIKGENEVFLSEIDPENIPADLYIRFDNQKELKVIGKETTKIKSQTRENINPSSNSHSMQIQPDTVEQRTMQEHMEDEFGMGFKNFGYDNKRRFTRWNVFLTLIFISILGPILDTYSELGRFYKSTKEIEEERMKQIGILKKSCFQKVLLENKDFNQILQ